MRPIMAWAKRWPKSEWNRREVSLVGSGVLNANNYEPAMNKHGWKGDLRLQREEGFWGGS